MTELETMKEMIDKNIATIKMNIDQLRAVLYQMRKRKREIESKIKEGKLNF